MDAGDGADPTAVQQRSDQPAQPKSAAPSPSTITRRTGSPFSPAIESNALELSPTDTENTPEQPRSKSTVQAPPTLFKGGEVSVWRSHRRRRHETMTYVPKIMAYKKYNDWLCISKWTENENPPRWHLHMLASPIVMPIFGFNTRWKVLTRCTKSQLQSERILNFFLKIIRDSIKTLRYWCSLNAVWNRGTIWLPTFDGVDDIYDNSFCENTSGDGQMFDKGMD